MESRCCTVPFQDCQLVAVIPLHKDLLQALQQKTFLKTKDQGQAPENSGNSHLLLVVAEPRDLPKVLNEKAMPRRKMNDRQAMSRRVVDSDNDYRALPWQSHQPLVVVQRRRRRILPEQEISPKRRKKVNHGVIEHQPCCLCGWIFGYCEIQESTPFCDHISGINFCSLWLVYFNLFSNLLGLQMAVANHPLLIFRSTRNPYLYPRHSYLRTMMSGIPEQAESAHAFDLTLVKCYMISWPTSWPLKFSFQPVHKQECITICMY